VYEHDIAMFVYVGVQDISTVREILRIFGDIPRLGSITSSPRSFSSKVMSNIG
jgi:hypothetical protein